MSFGVAFTIGRHEAATRVYSPWRSPLKIRLGIRSGLRRLLAPENPTAPRMEIAHGPQPIDSVIYFPEDEKTLRETLEKILPNGAATLHPEEICLDFLRFAVSHIALGPAVSETSGAYIRQQMASCGG